MSDISSCLAKSKRILMQSWPLQAFIATNPLWSMRDEKFLDLVERYDFNMTMDIDYYHHQYQLGNVSDKELCRSIYKLTSKELNDTQLKEWISESISMEKKPDKKPVLYCQQLDEFRFKEPTLWVKENILLVIRNFFSQSKYKNLLTFWRETQNIEKIYSDDQFVKLIELFLKKITIPASSYADYFEEIYLSLYGWSSFINWLASNPDNPWLDYQANCHDIIIMWLYYESVMCAESGVPYMPPVSENKPIKNITNYKKVAYIWHVAFEITYINGVLVKINQQHKIENVSAKGQFVFCIDTRSEGLRRRLEERGYDTYGFAGFFAVAFKLKCAKNISYQSPALVKPNKTVKLSVAPSNTKRLLIKLNKLAKYIKEQLFSPFVFFESFGIWYGLYMLYKTVMPQMQFIEPLNKIKYPDVLWDPSEKGQAFCIDEVVEITFSFLMTIGLIKNFANTVIICGHQSNVVNNPYKAGLDCGACGGNSGIANAIMITNMLNHPQVRQRLKDKGIIIPEKTNFVAACHHTVHDRVEVHGTHCPDLITIDLQQACAKLRQEKSLSLPGYFELKRREVEWSELIPELGLANNAAIVIGPRWLTQSLNLQRRVFLHSYEPSIDEEGEILTALLSAPAVVAHWINAQYYFSTVSPQLFGAGNKAIHNVLPQIGVMEGNLSDLQVGLPQQSVYFQDSPLHEPRRLLVIVYARSSILASAMKKASDFTSLVTQEWVYFSHIEENTHE